MVLSGGTLMDLQLYRCYIESADAERANEALLLCDDFSDPLESGLGCIVNSSRIRREPRQAK